MGGLFIVRIIEHELIFGETRIIFIAFLLVEHIIKIADTVFIKVVEIINFDKIVFFDF